MELRIESPCRVKLRCGGELEVEPNDGFGACPIVCRLGQGVVLSWLKDGRYAIGVDSPFDIVEILSPAATEGKPEASVKLERGWWEDDRGVAIFVEPSGWTYPFIGSDPSGNARLYCANGKEASGNPRLRIVRKADPKPEPLITGPGRYPQRNGGIATLKSRDPNIPLNGPNSCPWDGTTADGLPETWGDDGHCMVSDMPQDIVGPRIEGPKPEPRLLEPLSEGEWWAVDCNFPTIRHKIPIVAREFADGGKAYIACGDEDAAYVSSDGVFELAGAHFQLLRRVIAPSVRPYETVEEKRQVLGETVRRKKDGRESRVDQINDRDVYIRPSRSSQEALSWPELASDCERLDGSPLGTVVTDPWE